eukprot:TRINITY_DN946_c0_g1_i1.p1 TRINITY_DN946_c0_g1~~TRINITY_DN946_c0_g1_i1.p1  ORF type:complete len:460 (+),score=99.23 TRINITY_DN946_c0_g1_i1:84-1463(+)
MHIRQREGLHQEKGFAEYGRARYQGCEIHPVGLMAIFVGGFVQTVSFFFLFSVYVCMYVSLCVPLWILHPAIFTGDDIFVPFWNHYRLFGTQKGFCPTKELSDFTLKDASLELDYYEPGDVVYAKILRIDHDDKIDLSFRRSRMLSSHSQLISLGKCDSPITKQHADSSSDDDYEVEVETSQETHETTNGSPQVSKKRNLRKRTGETSEEHQTKKRTEKKKFFNPRLVSDTAFLNPHAVESMCSYFRVRDYETLLPVKKYDPIDSFDQLREQQSKVWSQNTVAEGIAHAKGGNYKEAFRLYAEALNVYPNKNAYVARGAAFANQYQQDSAKPFKLLHSAIHEFQEALKIDPHDANAIKYKEACEQRLLDDGGVIDRHPKERSSLTSSQNAGHRHTDQPQPEKSIEEEDAAISELLRKLKEEKRKRKAEKKEKKDKKKSKDKDRKKSKKSRRHHDYDSSD